MSILEPKFKSILPTNEPNELKVIDALGCDVISRIDVSKVNLIPQKTDKKLLSELALLFDVDLNTLSDVEKRELISISNELHKYAGTPYALKKVFNSFQKEIKIVEWHESDGELLPYTFSVLLDKLDFRGAIFVIDLIKKFKNQRSVLKQIGDGSCQGRFRLDKSKLDYGVLEDVEGIEIAEVKVCFSTVRVTSITLPKIQFYKKYIRQRLHVLHVSKPTIFSYVDIEKNRAYLLQRTWTGAWNKSSWNSNDYAQLVGKIKHLTIEKSVKPNGYWVHDWSGRAWSENYLKNKELHRIIGLTITPISEFEKRDIKTKPFKLLSFWTGAWNKSSWNSNDYAQLVGKIKHLTIEKSVKPNGYWVHDWSGRAWSENYLKNKELHRIIGLTITPISEFEKRDIKTKPFKLLSFWTGAWSKEMWNKNYIVKGEKNVSF